MAKYTLPSGVVVETADEVGSRVYGAKASTTSSPKPAAKKAAPKKQATTKTGDK